MKPRQAVFKPLNRDNLHPEVEKWIDKEVTVHFLWVAETDEAYAGQKLWSMPDEFFQDTSRTWVPNEDLEFK